ncbi:hypothetical protein [Herbaspirillum sp. VT-16-41]|uniref:hypothetical protein n=1 Tax=Herbaspirillum sp. VT-16-41 TaxID=1953765 RepID=UPI000981FED1|nr:hypothetical protein [Herbaspirillum sp. VT-16-41]ONN67814.1 hypothetical protein BTM36_04585 [Herbaspirillum sp. VT-16-41]
MSDIEIFARQVQRRSAEHKQAMALLWSNKLYGLMVSVLRQELDSMVRVIFLLGQEPTVREQLVADSVYGRKWKIGREPVTDRKMVDFAQKLYGWTASVYKFGCAFIHLSALHDYSARDPLQLLPSDEREDILSHCRHYHGGPVSPEAGFADLISFLPLVLEKVADNLEFHLDDLLNGRSLETV